MGEAVEDAHRRSLQVDAVGAPVARSACLRFRRTAGSRSRPRRSPPPGGSPARPAPSRMTVRSRPSPRRQSPLLKTTCSPYRPSLTSTVSPARAASIAAWIVLNSSGTTSVRRSARRIGRQGSRQVLGIQSPLDQVDEHRPLLQLVRREALLAAAQQVAPEAVLFRRDPAFAVHRRQRRQPLAPGDLRRLVLLEPPPEPLLLDRQEEPRRARIRPPGPPRDARDPAACGSRLARLARRTLPARSGRRCRPRPLPPRPRDPRRGSG